MKTTINYEENLFYIDSIIKTIEQGLTVSIDTEITYEHIKAQFQYIDQALGKIYSSLEETPNIKQKALYIKLLINVKLNYIQLLDRIITNKFDMSPDFEVQMDTYRSIIRNHKTDIDLLKKTIKQDKEHSPEDVISSAELDFLLATSRDSDNDTARN
ncbi:hypothetical protein [Spirochaeta cellobiosiphila]|uniref:hypothetical protein n=1 Tax=Spirochaeta cellobiosiphila TaxID=504483 RepID=UPI0003FB96C3|nr:hypothetical protein [Spirochaeta cellobiosiphila]